MGLVQKRTLVVLHPHASGNRETSAEGAKNTGVPSEKAAVNNERRRKGKGQASSSVPTEKDGLTTNAGKVQSPDLRLEPKFLPMGGKMWKIVLPCVAITSLETGASMAIIACIDMLMVRRNPARGRRVRVLKEQLRF